MNHHYRVERLCIGQCGAGDDACALTEKEVTQAFATLGLGIEQLLGRMPGSVSSVSTRYTQDGLDIRLHSGWDGATVRNLVTSVVVDVNAGHPGLNLSVITRAVQAPAAAAPTRVAALPIDMPGGALAPISVLAGASQPGAGSGLQLAA